MARPRRRKLRAGDQVRYTVPTPEIAAFLDRWGPAVGQAITAGLLLLMQGAQAAARQAGEPATVREAGRTAPAKGDGARAQSTDTPRTNPERDARPAGRNGERRQETGRNVPRQPDAAGPSAQETEVGPVPRNPVGTCDDLALKAFDF